MMNVGSIGVSPMRWRTVRTHVSGWMVLAGIVSAGGCGRQHDRQEIASLYLTCAAAFRGVQCSLLALSRDVSRPPRDVTADASWQLSGIAGAQITRDGVIDAPTDGDVEVIAQYASHRAQRLIRLVRDGRSQMLAAVRGHVYVEQGGTLWPVPEARVEVIGGSSAGASATTREDGSYELVGVAPDDVVIRATKIGCTAVEASTRLQPGDNRLSLLITTAPSTTALAS